jgi:hypothetical protein
MLNAALMKAINLAVPIGRVSKHKYPAWFSSRLKTYFTRKIIFTDVTKN